MKRWDKSAPRFAVCVNNEDYPASLELHKIYRVLPDEDAAADGDLRVVDESGEDYLYPAEWFVPIEPPRSGAVSVAGRFNARKTRSTDAASRQRRLTEAPRSSVADATRRMASAGTRR